MLIDDEKHRRHHTLGPKDCYFGSKRKTVAAMSVTRSTIADEQMSVTIPVFEDDTREMLSDRVGMLLSVIQERRDDAARAWEVAEENQERIMLQKKQEQGKLTDAEKHRFVELQKK